MADPGRNGYGAHVVDASVPGLLSRAGPVRKVVVVRPGRIGDFLCATPAFRALRAALPSAELTVVGLPFVRELVPRSPDIDRFQAFPGFPGIAEQFFDARTAVAFLGRMQEERFDLAVQLYGSGVYSNPFTLLLGDRLTAGFVRPDDGPGRLDAALPLPQEGHEVDRVLALPAFLGAPTRGRADEGVGRQLSARVGPPCTDLSGRTTLPVLGAVLARLGVLVTTDSGPAHVAYAVGAPSVTLFVGSDPRRWGPPPSPGRRALVAGAAGISAEQVEAAAEELLVASTGGAGEGSSRGRSG